VIGGSTGVVEVVVVVVELDPAIDTGSSGGSEVEVGVAQALATVSAAITPTIFLPGMAISIPPTGSSFVTVRL
jgi:hypothetical protein